MKIIKGIVVSSLLAFTILASSPAAFAQVNTRHYVRNNNFYRTSRNVVRSNVFNRNVLNRRIYDRNINNRIIYRNRFFDRDRFIYNNRYFRGNTVYLGSYYNRYVPYTFYTRSFPYYSSNPLFVIVNRDNPTDALVVGNTAYYGSNYRNAIVIRVSDSYFQMLRDAIQNNNLSDFRFDRYNNAISFSTPSGPFSTSDVGISSY